MKNKIIDLIDFEKVNNLLEGFNKTTGFVTAILDLQGNILSKSGWRQMCTEFHRVHPETSKNCTVSDIELSGKLAEGEKYHFYKCLNGLIDVAVPIIISGEHIANLFSGQFFFEEPDRMFFKKQAEKFGFDEAKYLEALEKVPVVSKEKVQTAMEFLLNMTQVISEMTLQKLEQIELTEAFKQSEERWQFAIEGNGDGLWDWNVQTNEIYFSNNWKEMLGFHENEMENKFDEWEKRVHPDDKIKVYIDLQKHLDGLSDVYTNEYRMLCKDGGYKWILDRGKIVSRNSENKPLRFIGTHTDITERKQNEELILGNKNRLDFALNSIDTGVWELDLLNGNSWRSFKHDKIFGYVRPLEHWTYDVFLEHVIPEDKILVDRKFKKAVSTKKDWNFECRINRKDGAVRWILGKGIYKLNDKDESIKMYGIVQDITDRKLAEETLKESEKMLSVIFNNHSDLQLLVNIDDDGELRIKAINNPYINTASNFGIHISAENILGKPLSELFQILNLDNEIFESSIAKYKAAATKKEPITYIESIVVLGQTYTSEITLNPVMNEKGNCQYILYNSHNITEQTRANAALLESEEKFRLAFLTSPDSININRLEDGMYMDVNDSFTQISGYTREEIIGKTSVEINIWENNKDRSRLVVGLKKYGKVANLEAKFKLKNGRVIDGLMSASVISIAGVQHILSITRDITEHKLAEETLKLSEEKFGKSFKLSPYMVSLTTMDGLAIEVNDKVFDTFGYTRDEFIGKSTTELKLWVNRDERSNFVEKLKDNGTLHEMDVRFRKKSGEIGDYLLSASIIEVSEGKLLLSIIHDITERKQKEIALQESEQRYRDLFENSHAVMLLIDTENGNIISANPAASTFYGWSNAELVSMNMSQINNLSKDELNSALFQAVEKNRKYFVIDHVLADQTIRNVEVYTAPIIIKGKKLLYSIIHDVTDRTEAEVKIKKLNEELEIRVDSRTKELSDSQDALLNIVEDLNEKTVLLEKSTKLLETKNKELETFTYSVSHDLKAPLRGIDGYSRLLQEIYSGTLDDEAKQFIKTIRESTVQMNQLIEDLLAYSRLERTSVRISKLNIKRLIDSILTLLKNEIIAYKVNVTLEVNDLEIIADFDGLSIALRNLVENAIKFSRQSQAPKIKIVLKENVYSWLISVADNGIGFDMKYHDRIFEIFQRLNLPEKYKGTGIGLAMVNKSMERMGGKVWAESKPGSGAIFYIELPKT